MSGVDGQSMTVEGNLNRDSDGMARPHSSLLEIIDADDCIVQWLLVNDSRTKWGKR